MRLLAYQQCVALEVGALPIIGGRDSYIAHEHFRETVNKVVSVINHIHQYPSVVFVIVAFRRAKEMCQRSLIALPHHGKHMLFVASSRHFRAASPSR